MVGYEASGNAETMKAQETGSLRPTQTNWGMIGGKGENVRPRRSNSPGQTLQCDLKPPASRRPHVHGVKPRSPTSRFVLASQRMLAKQCRRLASTKSAACPTSALRSRTSSRAIAGGRRFCGFDVPLE